MMAEFVMLICASGVIAGAVLIDISKPQFVRYRGPEPKRTWISLYPRPFMPGLRRWGLKQWFSSFSIGERVYELEDGSWAYGPPLFQVRGTSKGLRFSFGRFGYLHDLSPKLKKASWLTA